MPWRCGMMLRLQFNNRVALSSCNRRVPFDVVPDTSAFALPADLHTIAVKLQAYAVGDSFPGLTHEEVALLQRKYIHLSGHWNAASGKNNSDIEVLFINRPATGGKRAVHPNE
jgi:hypothetical protein